MYKVFDRTSFFMYIDGISVDRQGEILVDRKAENVFVCNKVDAQNAIKELDAGHIIYLSSNNKIISTVHKTKKGYIEKPVARC